MRAYKKKELLEILATLEQANDLVRSQGTGAGMLDTLAQCQEAAVAIGGCLETEGEKGKEIVGILEEYCESIYQITLMPEDSVRCRKISKKIRRELSAVKNGIQYGVADDKKEVVFLPYKASMWDSMESVWIKASADENCETYVVPIPYFDKNPDGSLAQQHYEGNEYPEYVPIVSWKEYNIPARRPDIVYIHNPYDNGNYITSVHPAFYASELRNYTDMLVYIPYFICINNGVKEEFCIQPGVIYANKVILQSEEVRKAYIEIYHRWEAAQGCRDVFGKAEEKFVADGSPKLEKIDAVKREDFEIPEDWERLIKEENGITKKVILYNTTIGAMLSDTEKMLEKIKRVLRTFQEDKEVVLLWRPHPLLGATMKSMRSDLAQVYEDIVEEYKEGNWGIYDESSDLYRAIVTSDAYYGDWSSVVELYKRTRKPIMIQDVET